MLFSYPQKKKKKVKKKILYVMSFLIYWFPEFEELNPLHFVPVLVDGDVVVSDSYAILLVRVLCL